mmetsp:Transcript_13078/g.52713  ORF Transcript_13078/g.52713 Transcript_13078/m.52713 type:complete len:252 (-) Transcript_13078:614-1369(-)
MQHIGMPHDGGVIAVHIYRHLSIEDRVHERRETGTYCFDGKFFLLHLHLHFFGVIQHFDWHWLCDGGGHDSEEVRIEVPKRGRVARYLALPDPSFPLPHGVSSRRVFFIDKAFPGFFIGWIRWFEFSTRRQKPSSARHAQPVGVIGVRRVAANASARRSSQHRGREGPDLTRAIVFQRAESLGQLLKLGLGSKIRVPVKAVSEHARSPGALARGAHGFERGDPRGLVPFLVEGDIKVGRDLLLRELLGRDP